MLISQKLIRFSQALERLNDKLLTFLHIVENLWPKQKETAVDPQIGAVPGPDRAHPALLFYIGHVVGKLRTYRQETGKLAALLKPVQHVVEVDIAQAVAVVGKEYLFALYVI